MMLGATPDLSVFSLPHMIPKIATLMINTNE